MAPRAPRPGTTPSSRAGKQGEEAFTGFKITMFDEVLLLNFADIGPMDEQIFESQTTKTLSEVMDKLDHTPNVASLVWLARRKRGERKLGFKQVLREFPSRMELAEMFNEGTFDLDVISDDADEGEEGATPDPLPSAAD